ncbi:MAG: hypothetical protein KAX19_12560, partial [Candidatus Brocadiae bacterium]|nr:hypothetical protein [Candidatus Brocadiia bacterium]
KMSKVELKGFWNKYKRELGPIASALAIIAAALAACGWFLGQEFWRTQVPLWALLVCGAVTVYLVVRLSLLCRSRVASVTPDRAGTARLAQVFHGEWDKGYWELDGEGPRTEKVEFDDGGTYYKNGKACYVARDVAIDPELQVVRFSLFWMGGEFFQEEYLAGADRKAAVDRQDRFLGSCSHGHRIEYRRSPR